MRGLTKEERQALVELVSANDDEIETDEEEEMLWKLTERGLASVKNVPFDCECCGGAFYQVWSITERGKLALRVCTVTP